MRFTNALIVAAMVFAANFAHAADTVCVRVQMEIDQTLTLERQGFQASMTLNNNGASPLDNLKVVVNFSDQNNKAVYASSDPNDTNAKFFLTVTSTDSTGQTALPTSVAAGASPKMTWLIVPTISAGGTDPNGQLYYVGASVSYTAAGVDSSVDVTPSSIRVKPLPKLILDYYLPSDIPGDDPLTPQVEPSPPFAFGLRVSNVGAGTASNLQIQSAQPRITENHQGLPVSFQILSCDINNAGQTPTLLANIGTLASNTVATVRWEMTATYAGKFTAFDATYSHSDSLGGQMTSLITVVNTHTLVHEVMLDQSGQPATLSFLARDSSLLSVPTGVSGTDASSQPTPVTDLSAQARLQMTAPLVCQITAPASTGFSYIQLSDPWNGRKQILSAYRSDGRVVNPSNVWFSSSFDPQKQLWSYFVNVFDTANPAAAAYNISVGDPLPGKSAPLMAALANLSVVTGKTVQIPVSASDLSPSSLRLWAVSLPAGASFVDKGNGAGLFTWTPTGAQLGAFPVQFDASNSTYGDAKTCTITVYTTPFQSWVAKYWGTESDPAIVGPHANPSGDGIPNLLKYAMGGDPTKSDLGCYPHVRLEQVGDQHYLTLTYTQVKLADDITYIPEVTEDLQVWNRGAGYMQTSVTDNGDGLTQTVVVQDLVPASSCTKRFMRLKVTTP